MSGSTREPPIEINGVLKTKQQQQKQTKTGAL